MSRAYLRLGESAKANQLLERAASLAPKRAEIRAQLAMGRLAEGKRGEATDELERAIELGSGANQAGSLLAMLNCVNVTSTAPLSRPGGC
ncbi:MAG: hypothetical protein HOI95_18945 [Chromatiales bacterium]|jgi:Flp pilus assembly protein TadD|nr:hypothetical protein [Chromatiales bacterium]